MSLIYTKNWYWSRRTKLMSIDRSKSWNNELIWFFGCL